MGVHIPASLAYGVVVRDEQLSKLPWYPEPGFDSWVRRSAGMTEDTCPIAELLVYSEDDGEEVVMIAVRDSVSTANWRGNGKSNPIVPKMTVAEIYIESAKDFCRYYGVPFMNPGWVLSVCFLQ